MAVSLAGLRRRAPALFLTLICDRACRPPLSRARLALTVPVLCWPFAATAADVIAPAAGITAGAPAAAAPAPEASAAAGGSPAADDTGPQQWAVHGQSTFVQQFQPAFHSPYQGPQSLPPPSNGRETWDVTLYAGFRPWRGAEIWINPEIDQGFGIGNSFGVAGYVSGEAYKLGKTDPYYRMAKAFIRQTIDLGGDTQTVDADLNQLAGTQTENRIVVTAGKLSVVDIFDTNKYAHDPRNDFLNWAILDAGSFDYAADAWGATYGAAAEWYQGPFAARIGIFDMPNVPNSTALSLPLLQQTQFVAELEERHKLWDHPGRVTVAYWLSRGNLGTYSDALAQAAGSGMPPSTDAVANYRSKFGLGFNVEQEILPDLGFFAKGGVSQADVQEDSFTDITESLAVGLSLTGARWNRPDDTVGLAGVASQISHQGKLYLAAGGLGGIIGDGQLPAAGPEQILETYYSFAAFGFAKVTADYQFVNNPAYNRQRGPVSVFALRLHAQF